ncbi:MAG: hypothetical protein ACKOZW_12810 [Cyanobium sp.]
MAICFSAAASFAAAALVLPIGVQALRLSRAESCVAMRPLAWLPLGFALQQALEGWIWTLLAPTTIPPPLSELVTGAPSAWLPPLSLAYLFFAYALWPAWIPWCALVLARERVGAIRFLALRLLLGCGVLLGLILWLPVAAHPLRAVPTVMGGSLHYGAVDLLRGSPLAGLGPAIYLLLIIVPLLLVPARPVRLFALSLGLSALISQLWWQHTFSSVWCWFSALLSCQILLLLAGEAPLRPPAPPLPPPPGAVHAS